VKPVCERLKRAFATGCLCWAGALWLLLPALPARAAEVPAWFYEVSVPVASQLPADRKRASSDALLVMLSRVTGLAHPPRTEPVTDALASPERYYNEFSYTTDEDGELELVVQFDPAAVLALQKQAALPIWRSARNRVVAWVVIEQNGERALVGADTPDELAPVLIERARARGVDLTVPLLDLEDRLEVTPAVVWGRLSQVLETASERYGADVLLVGRVSLDPTGEWSGEWEFWIGTEVITQDLQDEDLPTQVANTVDLLADELASRSAVLGRESSRLRLSVSGVRNAADYGELLEYLESQEFIDSVHLTELTGSTLEIEVATRAGPDQLLSLFEADQRLFSDRLAPNNSADLRLVWRQQ
jgi:hypothetical protein